MIMLVHIDTSKVILKFSSVSFKTMFKGDLKNLLVVS